MEFDRSKILTVVTADQAKVGSMGYFSNYIPALKEYVTGGYNRHTKLIRVSLDTIYPFFDGYNYYSLFYPALEPTYEERQAEWIKENNVKVGTRVRFTKGFKTAEDGSKCREHRDAKGIEGVVSSIEDEFLLVRVPSDGWAVPFTALEVIKEPTYRPYNGEELNYIVGKLLIRKGCGYPCLVTSRCSIKQVVIEGYMYSAEQLLELFTLNGEPCGVREEA